jgi:hypothetical protein
MFMFVMIHHIGTASWMNVLVSVHAEGAEDETTAFKLRFQ